MDLVVCENPFYLSGGKLPGGSQDCFGSCADALATATAGKLAIGTKYVPDAACISNAELEYTFHNLAHFSCNSYNYRFFLQYKRSVYYHLADQHCPILEQYFLAST